MRFDPWRALVVLAIAGSLIIVPPSAGYAMSALDPGFGTRSNSGAVQQQRLSPSGAVQSVFNDNDDDEDDNTASADNDNAAPDVNDNDNAAAAPAPAPAPPAPDEGTDNPAYHWHNDPNNNGT